MFIYWGLMLTIPAVLIMFGAGRLEDRIIEEGFLPLAIPVGLAIGGIVPFVVWMIFGFDGQVSDAYDALAKYTLGSGVMWSASFFFRVPPMPKADPY
jgi:pyruvate/2-oxoglutarate/acetoin dehydrogenase E1 component